MEKDEASLRKEISRLRRKIKQWQKLDIWRRMERNYGMAVAIANLGCEPKTPKTER